MLKKLAHTLFIPKFNNLYKVHYWTNLTENLSFQPYVRGRILYTPDTKATQKLMKIVNQAFSPVENLRNFTTEYTNKYSKRIRKLIMNRDTQEMLKDIVITNGTDSIFDSFSKSPIGKLIYLTFNCFTLGRIHILCWCR